MHYSIIYTEIFARNVHEIKNDNTDYSNLIVEFYKHFNHPKPNPDDRDPNFAPNTSHFAPNAEVAI